jgi:hypothetical protein
MDDMNAFERQLADESIRIVGPSGSVDAGAVFQATVAATSPRWRFQSKFSATRFVVAGFIVAMFGGLLLAGVPTQSSGDPLPAAVSTASTKSVSPSTRR